MPVIDRDLCSWEEFDEWLNLDKTPPAALRWEGEIPATDEPDEADEELGEEPEPELADVESEPADSSKKPPLSPKKKLLKKKPRTRGPEEGEEPAVTTVPNIEDQLSYITEKISRLEGVMNPCISLKEVESFESKSCTTLPSQYRNFILQVGDGGLGPPRQGIPKLAEISQKMKYKLEEPFPFHPDDMPPPAQMYLGQRRLFTGGILPGDTKTPDAKEAEIVRKFNEQAWGGLMFVGTDGNGDDHYLAVNGPGSGGMWLLAEDCFWPQEMDFLEWYMEWLDRQQSDKPILSGINSITVRKDVLSK